MLLMAVVEACLESIMRFIEMIYCYTKENVGLIWGHMTN